MAKKNGHTSATSSTYDDNIDSESQSVKVSLKSAKHEENGSIEKTENRKCDKEDSEKRVLDCRDDPPPGTVYPLPQNRVRKEVPKGGWVEGAVGSVMCCSDKIAKWNAIGS